MIDSFKSFILNYPFTYIDVGARWGAKCGLLDFFPRARWVGFEPDPVEYEVLQRKLSERQKVLPYAIGAKEERRAFFVTKSPDWSSTYEPDLVSFRQFHALEGFGEIVKRCEVAVRPLDGVAREEVEWLSSSDYLKVDVQGGELDVLVGAGALLENEIRGVEVEVEFDQLYKGQPLFGEIHQKLTCSGFVLMDLSRNRCWRSGFGRLAGSRGQLVWGDAIYLKDYKRLLKKGMERKLFGLISIAVGLSFFDYALSAAEAAVNAGLAVPALIAEVSEVVRSRTRRSCVIDIVAKTPLLRGLLRYFCSAIDRNYDEIVRAAHPEYYFMRD